MTKKGTNRACFFWKIGKISKNVYEKNDVLMRKHPVSTKTAYQNLLKPLTNV